MIRRAITAAVLTATIATTAGCFWGSGGSASKSTPALGMMTGPKAYMFGISGAEIDSALRFYCGQDVDKTTRARARWQLSQPFDPNKFGDLAYRVGPDNTKALLHYTWKMAMTKTSPSTMQKRIESEISKMEKAWYRQSFPSGIEDDSSFWTDSLAFEFGDEDQVMTVALDAPEDSSATFESAGDFRVKQRSGVVDLGVYASCWAEARSFAQNKNGYWVPAKMSNLSVDGSAFAKTDDTVMEHGFSNTKNNTNFVSAYFAWDDMDNFYRAFAASSCAEASMKGSRKAEPFTISACSDTRN